MTVRAWGGPTAGLVAATAVLAALAATVGLGVAGWSVGVAHALVTWLLLRHFRQRTAAPAWGPADTVTSARSALAGGVAALVADALAGLAPAPVVVAGLAAVALALDGVDGWVARRTGTASAFGARFDVETDSFLALALAVFVAGTFGWWAVVVGLPRYAFLAAGRALPWLRQPVPVRRSSKVVAAVQGTVLVVVSAGVLPVPVATVSLGVVLGLLSATFGRDIRWLWRTHGRPLTLRGAPPAVQVLPTVRGTPLTVRGAAGRVVTSAAFVLVLAALTMPDRLDHLTPVAFLRIPAEGLLAAGLLLVVPGRARRVTAALLGTVVGLATVLTIVDMGFFSVLARPFDPVLDWPLLGAAVDFLADETGTAGAVGVVAAVAVLAATVLVATALSAVRLAGPLTRHRTAAAAVVGVLAVAWGGAAAADVHVRPGVPLAVHQGDRVVDVGASLRDRQMFAAEIGADDFRDTPADALLTALRGKDVVVAFVESYGRDAVTDPRVAPGVPGVLAEGGRRLDAAGFTSRSAFLTSPTVGGGSWLAHATLRSGAWVDNPQRHDTVLRSGRLTLPGAFQRAGWRTVAVTPASVGDWPEGKLFGFDHVYTRGDLDYHGPRMNWGVVPDQYTLAALQRHERTGDDRPPVMAEVSLVSSHLPWTPVAPLRDWDAMGDGSGYHSAGPAEESADAVLRDPDQARAAYGRALGYSLDTLVSYVETYGDDDLVLVLLGDHAPPPRVTDSDPGADVPVTIVASDPAVHERVADWGWHDGLRPGPGAPVWRMDSFRDRFLAAFGPQQPASATADP